MNEIDSMHLDADFISTYLSSHKLVLVSAESCTAGTIVAMLSDIEGCAEFMECGFVTYARKAKQRILNVQSSTIEAHTLTSEEVAREMAAGALRNSTANVAVATTGVAGPKPMDGIPPGVVCLAWAFRPAPDAELMLFSRTIHLDGDRTQVREQASRYAINGVVYFHQQLPDRKTA